MVSASNVTCDEGLGTGTKVGDSSGWVIFICFESIPTEL